MSQQTIDIYWHIQNKELQQTHICMYVYGTYNMLYKHIEMCLDL